MEQIDLQRAISAILFAAGEPVDAKRIAFAVETDEEEVHTAAQTLMDRLAYERSGIRILKL